MFLPTSRAFLKMFINKKNILNLLYISFINFSLIYAGVDVGIEYKIFMKQAVDE